MSAWPIDMIKGRRRSAEERRMVSDELEEIQSAILEIQQRVSCHIRIFWNIWTIFVNCP